jgi:hypothetical protein
MGRDRLVRQPWSDVSVTFIREPGGKTYRYEPTLISRKCLEQDLTLARKSGQSRPAKDNSTTLDRLERITRIFDSGARFHIESRSPDELTPEIYTSNDFIDQAEAEKMLVHFLRTQGLTDPGFQWIWPEFICSVG